MKLTSVYLALVFIVVATTVSCDSGSKKAEHAGDTPLVALPSSAARIENDEGLGHFQQGHWDVALEHYRKAVTADPNSAVVHYNIALTLDKMGKHDDATASFKKALELGPNDPAIRDSEILKKHLGM